MRIDTNATRDQVVRAIIGLPGVWAEVLTEHHSATHARAFELVLAGNGGQADSGRHGAGEYRSVTWDEWGTVMGRVYVADPSARMGGTAKCPIYADAADFHWQTGTRFADGVMPADAHPTHRWAFRGTPGVHECSQCSAVWRWRL